ncbi:MAG TPA: hypothetical protein PLH23_05465 [Hyphomonadaceae bacterium]|nr:hypothetical protein [Hyphomonadaceae bacterium]HPI47697.1 hypothetical protein [Hyphomonadaceae bacterium]
MNAVTKFNVNNLPENVRQLLERAFNKELREAYTENAKTRVKRNKLVLSMYEYKLEATKRFDESRLADEDMTRREREEVLQERKEARLQASENRQLQHQQRRIRDFLLDLEMRRLEGLSGDRLDDAIRRGTSTIFDNLVATPGSPVLQEPESDSGPIVASRRKRFEQSPAINGRARAEDEEN